MAAGNPLSSGPGTSGKGKSPLGPPGKGGKFGAWIKKHPGEAAAGAGVLAVGGFALYRSKSAGNAAASNGTTGTAGGVSGYTDTGTATPYDYGSQYGGGSSGSSSADAAAVEAQLNTLSGQLSKLSFSKNGYLKTVSENGKKNPAPVKVITKPKPKKPKKPKVTRGKVTSRLRPPIRK
jgi:hypothetical protein